METCPCCGYITVSEKRSYDICPICFWEDDIVQFNDPDYEGGANGVSLRQAQINYTKFGACEKLFLKNVRRPSQDEQKDPNWEFLVEGL